MYTFPMNFDVHVGAAQNANSQRGHSMQFQWPYVPPDGVQVNLVNNRNYVCLRAIYRDIW